jgi:membrane protease YdiL (CAAX protease family)
MNRTLRNLIVFSLCTLAAGWLGAWLNQALDLPPAQNLGMLVFLVTPLLVSLLLRLSGGDGWKDLGLRPNFRGNGGWYALGLLAYPVLVALTLGIGALAGAVSFPRADWDVFLQLVGVSLVGNFFKNLFEEFAWRGYLAPRLDALGVPRLANHLITGAVWACWHIPYWLFLLDQATIASFTSLGLTTLVVLSIIAILPSAILYGELRLRTGSTWPAMLLHTVGNALTLVLLVDGFVSMKAALEAIFTPGVGGLFGTLLFTLVGVWAYTRRRGDARAERP